MATIKLSYGSPTSLTVSALSTLASANYATSNAYQVSTNNPLDVQVEVSVTSGTVAGNKQAVLFIIGSSDGSNYDVANSGSTDTTHDTQMMVLGVIPLPNNTEAVRRRFSVAAAFGGLPPPYFKVIVKNDSGAAFTAGTATTTEVSASVS